LKDEKSLEQAKKAGKRLVETMRLKEKVKDFFKGPARLND
jgi:hypothetical protein